MHRYMRNRQSITTEITSICFNVSER